MISRSRILITLYLVCFGATRLLANADAPSSGYSAKRDAQAASIPLFAAGKWEEAEAVLHRANAHTSGTAQWQREAAGNLLAVAAALENQNRGALSVDVAKLALVHLAGSEKEQDTLPPLDLANEREIIGYIYEHYLGDRKLAETWYADAVAASGAATTAAHRLAALKVIDAAEARKVGH